MAYEIRYNKLFVKESKRIAEWLEKKWSKNVADNFTELLYSKILHLSDTPYAGIITKKNKNVRKLIITKHNVIYYRVKVNKISILRLFETKQHPKKNNYE